MAQLSCQSFVDYVEEWIVVNESAIAQAWPQKGGWEGWAQTDICSFILKKDSTYDILREQPVYNYGGIGKKPSADFLLNDQSSKATDKVVVELKCQSFENYKNFSKELVNDVSKLSKDLTMPDYQGATLLAVGIYFTQYPDIPNYFSRKVLGKGEVGICLAVDLGN